ncbi:MAG: VOC family protein [Propionibacteriaceae bacterium]
MTELSNDQVAEALTGTNWRQLVGEINAAYATGDFASGAAFVARITEVAEEAGHHPDVTLSYPRVSLRVRSHDVAALTQRDIDLARAIDAVAAELGHPGDLEAVQVLEIGIDAMDVTAIRPFWKAVLGYADFTVEGDSDNDTAHPAAGAGPNVWFQQMTEPRPQRNRVHLDVHVPAELAPARVDAALAAGGRLVTEAFAPSWWVLADSEGNEACVCTSQARD